MRQTLRVLYFPLKILIIVLLTPILSLGYWFFAIVIGIPLYIFRKVLLITARVLDPDITNLINSNGNLTSRDFDQWYTSPSQAITVVLNFKGVFEVNKVSQFVLKKLIHKFNNIHQHKLEYPELQQYFTKRLGFLFLKWDRKFNIANHFSVYSDKELLPYPETEIVDKTKLMQIWEKLGNKPFLPKRSPWDVHFIPNYDPNGKNLPEGEKNGIFIVRVQHGLCDGIIVYKLLLELTDTGVKNVEKDITPFRKPAPFYYQLLHLKAFFLGPASVVKLIAAGVDAYNPLHLPLNKKVGKWHIVQTTVDLERIKNIRIVHLEVSFHSVLLAVLSGGIRNYLLENGYKVPLAPIRVGLPIPKLGHTHKVRNDFLCALIDLPVEKKTARERLFKCEKKLREMNRTAFVPFMMQTWAILGMFPAWLARLLTLKAAYTVLFSEIKGPSKKLTMSDGGKVYDLKDLVFSFGLGVDDLHFGFSSLSYNGKIHLVVSLDHAVAKTRDKAESLLRFIEQELDALEFGDLNNV